MYKYPDFFYGIGNDNVSDSQETYTNELSNSSSGFGPSPYPPADRGWSRTKLRKH